MSELTVKDFLLFYLKNSYIERSQIIARLMEHIENIHSIFAIGNLERNKHMKELNDIIKLLNTGYNSRLKTIRADNQIDDENDSKTFMGDNESTPEKSKKQIITKINKSDLDTLLADFTNINLCNSNSNENILQSLSSVIGLSNDDKLYEMCKTKFNYDEIDSKLKTFISSNGTNSIEDIFTIFINRKVSHVFYEGIDGYELINVLCKTFNPLSVVFTTTTDIRNKQTKIEMSSRSDTFGNDYEILLNNSYSVKICFIHEKKYKVFEINGYFTVDCLNAQIRTSQLCNQYIHDKKKILVDTMNNFKTKNNKLRLKINAIPTIFKDAYIKNMTLGELLSMNPIDFLMKMSDDYDLYQIYSVSNNFKSLFGEFIKANLQTKYNIIRCLLMGPIVATNNAGLLFSLTKENKNGSPAVADILYKNLNISSQLKLHKSNTYIKSEIEKFNNLDIDDIDLKKQIIMNNNIPQKVKKLALEKLEEMKTGNSEYHKQLQYVKIIAEYPWIGQNDNDIFSSCGDDIAKWHDVMMTTQNKLDDHVYGHKDCKKLLLNNLENGSVIQTVWEKQ